MSSIHPQCRTERGWTGKSGEGLDMFDRRIVDKYMRVHNTHVFIVDMNTSGVCVSPLLHHNTSNEGSQANRLCCLRMYYCYFTLLCRRCRSAVNISNLPHSNSRVMSFSVSDLPFAQHRPSSNILPS